MRVMTAWLSIALATAMVLPAPAQTDGLTREQMWYAPTAEDWAKPVDIPWQRTWEDALALAEETRKPILVCVNMDGEIASEHWAGIRYRDPEIAALFSQYVCVIASTYRHNARDYDAEGKRIPCPRFGTVTCGEHLWMEPKVYDLHLDETRVAPRHIMVELDGTETYDVYYALDIQSIVDTVEKGIVEREIQPEEPRKGDRTLAELIASPDAADRARIESTWQGGDRQARQEVMAAAEALGADAPVDLLRSAAYGFDSELSARALDLLADSGQDKAVGLIDDLLRGPLEPEKRAELLAALDRLAEQVPSAKRLAIVHRGLSSRSELLDLDAWTEGLAREDETEEATSEAAKLLEEAVSEDNLEALQWGSPRVRKVAEEMFRLARTAAEEELAAGATGWLPHAVVAIAGNYLGERVAAMAAAEKAVAQLPAGESSWNAYALLSLFADGRRQAIRDAADAKESWPPEWLGEIQSAYAVLAKHPMTSDSEIARQYDFLVRIRAVPTASRVLRDGMDSFPDSWALHERFRLLLLAEQGADGIERTYEAWLRESDAPPHLRWYAGQAALFTAEQMRKLNRVADADGAYARALEHFRVQGETAPETVESSRTYRVLALAGRARVALEQGRVEEARVLILDSFAVQPEAAASLDGLNVSPVGTARKVLAALQEAGDADGAATIQAALDELGELDSALLELPAFDREIQR